MNRFAYLLLAASVVPIALTAAEPAITGELMQWHKVTLTLDGPDANETNDAPNPFLDCRMTVTFTHESGSPRYVVPGYFAADGNASQTSASSGNKWRAHVAPDNAPPYLTTLAQHGVATRNVMRHASPPEQRNIILVSAVRNDVLPECQPPFTL